MKIPYATDEEVDALVGPGFAEWWRANSPKPKTIKIGRRRLPEVTFGEHRWAMPPATTSYVKPPSQIAYSSPELDEAADLVKAAAHEAHLEYLLSPKGVGGPANRRLAQIVAQPGPVQPLQAISRIGTKRGIEQAILAVPGVKHCEIVEDCSQSEITIWVDGDVALDVDIVDAIMQTKPAGIRTMGYDGNLGARFMRGTFHPWANSPTLQPGMTVQPSVGGIMIASTTGRVLPRTGDHARHKISKRIGIVTGVNHIDEKLDVDWQDGWKGAGFPWYEFEFATLLVAGIPIFHSDGASGETVVYHDERPATVVTSRVRVCAKCGNQSKHAESETSMGLCFDCFEARR